MTNKLDVMATVAMLDTVDADGVAIRRVARSTSERIITQNVELKSIISVEKAGFYTMHYFDLSYL